MMNKKTIIILSAILLWIPAKLFANDVDKIIAKHLAAHGDIKKWETVNTMKITGKFSAFSEEKDFICVKTKDGCYYSDLYLGQHKVKEAYNGKKGWTIDPWMDLGFARKVNPSEEMVSV